MPAIVREVREEVGVQCTSLHAVYEDMEADRLVRCYEITSWDGEPPHQCEPGAFIIWATLDQLTAPCCSFRTYNASLFAALGMTHGFVPTM